MEYLRDRPFESWPFSFNRLRSMVDARTLKGNFRGYSDSFYKERTIVRSIRRI